MALAPRLLCVYLMPRRPPSSPLFPYTTLFRSIVESLAGRVDSAWPPQFRPFLVRMEKVDQGEILEVRLDRVQRREHPGDRSGDRKSTRLNSSHLVISYAVFCLKKKNRPELAFR